MTGEPTTRDEGPERSLWVALTLKEAADGGRRTPIRSGYRADWALNGLNEDGVPTTLNGGPIRLGEDEELHPGKGTVAFVRPIAPQFWTDVRVGQELPMCEGARVVGLATVLEIDA